MTTLQVDTGSFRDREGRVFYHQGEVYRALSARALEAWLAVHRAPFFQAAMAAGKVVYTEQVEVEPGNFPSPPGEWAGVLRHRLIPFVSYPYEWSFSMLRDAALLHLELLEASLEEGFVLKDSSSYNVQWIGSSPTFIDVSSFQRLDPGEAWVGYLQFCQLFLYPLLLTAYRDLPFQSWLRGSLEGLSPEDMNHLLSLRDRFRPGVFAHVYLQSRTHRLTAGSRRSMRRELKETGFPLRLILHNVRGLRKIVSGLCWQRRRSTWSHYAREHSYGAEDEKAKQSFVREALAIKRWQRVWDLGANTGTFSRLAAVRAENVLAMDADPLAVDRLYKALAADGCKNVLPLVLDLTDPSPNRGFGGEERKAVTRRGLPDLTLCLALVHHLVLAQNLLVEDLLAWLAGLGGHLVLEYVGKDDPMVERLLLNKDDQYWDYEPQAFEAALKRHFQVLRRCPLPSETRVLYLARSATGAR